MGILHLNSYDKVRSKPLHCSGNDSSIGYDDFIQKFRKFLMIFKIKNAAMRKFKIVSFCRCCIHVGYSIEVYAYTWNKS